MKIGDKIYFKSKNPESNIKNIDITSINLKGKKLTFKSEDSNISFILCGDKKEAEEYSNYSGRTEDVELFWSFDKRELEKEAAQALIMYCKDQISEKQEQIKKHWDKIRQANNIIFND